MSRMDTGKHIGTKRIAYVKDEKKTDRILDEGCKTSGCESVSVSNTDIQFMLPIPQSLSIKVVSIFIFLNRKSASNDL
jgi:hypothetical protein